MRHIPINSTHALRGTVRRTLAAMLLVTTSTAAMAADQAPMTIVINQSPWFAGFQKVVELYQSETGNTVNLDVNPFAGSLEKQRHAVRTGESPYDVLIMNAGFFIEFYSGGFLEPLTNIEAGFKLSPDIYTFDDSVYWNAETKQIDAANGDLLSVPVNPFLPLLHYRADLYAEKGLNVPTTWDELYDNAKALHNPPAMYGISQRGQRGAFDVTFDVLPYVWSHGGAFFADQKGGDYTVTINSPETLAGMETYLKLAQDVGHPSTAGQTQTNVIQNMATGQAAHIQGVPAPALFDDPANSIVVGKVNYAPTPGTAEYPSSPPLGHWLAGVPKNIPDDRKAAALAFLTWFQTDEAQRAYAEAGSPPVSRAVLTSDLADKPEFRYMKALADSIPNARLTFVIPEASQVLAITELRLNQAISGELPLKEALNTAATEIAKVMTDSGYTAPVLPPLE
ncbi:MAG: extracellular solute-binding protein [Hoeflea sp.]|uniref:extracellular solute-binding protein n=1 Tax=Hoeflea sp. TaxID=1940281 RepID=UPI002731E8C3|nr:extracellular solute-binding protein [Hoeflea sp.]MDP2118599.1 extracellular solute-binding protein [Hoeflea sp.]